VLHGCLIVLITVGFRYLKQIRIKEPPILIRIKELPVSIISKTSKTHQVS
jgi:hypothetical protein